MGMEKKWVGYMHLVVVYLVWGSTYMAIRVAVREGSGFAPFSLGASRLLMGCFLVFLIAKISRKSFRMPRRMLMELAVASVLLWVGGNGLVTWASQHADSSYAAVLMGAIPIWMVGIESILDRRRPSLPLVLFLVLGFGGIVTMSWPSLVGAEPADFWSMVALIFAPIFWSAGTIIQKRRVRNLSPWVNSAYQQFFGGMGFLVMSLILREPLPTPSSDAWMAWTYLLIFGSVLAFTSYVIAVQLLPIRVVMTYSYVNPIIAILLGWFLLREVLTPWAIGGSIMILMAVFGIFQVIFSRKRNLSKPEAGRQ
jgi:drug/metabolite transporter (DMT)-like permease